MRKIIEKGEGKGGGVRGRVDKRRLGRRAEEEEGNLPSAGGSR